MSDVKQLISRSALFEGASEAMVEKFMERAETIRFAAGEIPVAETTVTDRILMIVEGELRLGIELQPPDQQFEDFQAGPGTFLGLVNFFGEVSQPFTATALSEVKALSWKVEDWRRLCEAEPAFGYQLSHRIGRELVERMSNWIQQLLGTVSWGV